MSDLYWDWMEQELGRKISSLKYSLSLALLLEKYINIYPLMAFSLMLKHSY